MGIGLVLVADGDPHQAPVAGKIAGAGKVTIAASLEHEILRADLDDLAGRTQGAMFVGRVQQGQAVTGLQALFEACQRHQIVDGIGLAAPGPSAAQ